ncbi:hypothetical protein Tco_0079768 [Tanacetum coccineum]
MLTKLQVFYDNAHKQALGYQNLFYLKKAQWIKPTLYDGSVISSQHDAIPVINDEETLILEEVSRSKMLAKQNDPISKEKKVNTTPILYVELNKLSEDFGKRFVPQQELSAEQAFWLQTSNPNTKQSDISPGRIEASSELPRVSLVSLKKLKSHLSKFDTVMKKRITPDAITEGEWGFKHTKAIFLKEIIPFLTTLKDIFNIVDRDLLNQDVLLSVMNSTTLNGESINFEMQRKYFKNNDLKAQLQAKDITICKLKDHKSMRENEKEEKVKHDMDEIETINIELEHRLKSSTSASRSQPTGNKKNDRISETPNPICDADVKHTMLNANSELICVKCKQCMFDANHDVCFLDFVNAVNVRSKSVSAKKIQKQNIWKPTGHMFTEIGYKWKSIGRLFTLVGNSCPLTRITPTKVVPIKESTSHSVETQKPEHKVYSMKPKQVKSEGSSRKDKIVESKNANN